ncbi:MAG: hypothetical protein J7K85_07450 [Anaerolineaceae bacterium]|nr:hypothetical protein [Anaerolineaceae bacterium]
MMFQRKTLHLATFLLITFTLILAGCAETDLNPSPEENPTLPPAAIQSTNTSLPPTPSPTPLPESTEIPTSIAGSEPIDRDTIGSLSVQNTMEIEYPRKAVWNEDTETITIVASEKIVTAQISDFSIISSTPLDVEIQLLDISPNGRFTAQTSDMWTIQIIDNTSGDLFQTLEPEEQFMDAHFSPDSNRILIPSLDNIKGIEFDVITGTRLNEFTGFSFGGPVYDVFYAQYSDDLIWFSRGSVMVMNRDSGDMSEYFGHQGFAESIALSPDGNLLVVATSAMVEEVDSTVLQFWNRHTGESIALKPTESYCHSLIFTPDGSLLIGAIGSNLSVWDMENHELLMSYLVHDDTINSITLSPDSTSLITTSFDNTLALWRVEP